VIGEYRKILLDDGGKRVLEKGVRFDRLKGDDRLSLGELLRHKVRYFEDGGVIGSRSFVEDVWEKNRDRFGALRKSGARPIRGCAVPLFALRDLHVRAIE
jgi:hypothetical protein